jgi:hypothetical protein
VGSAGAVRSVSNGGGLVGEAGESASVVVEELSAVDGSLGAGETGDAASGFASGGETVGLGGGGVSIGLSATEDGADGRSQSMT